MKWKSIIKMKEDEVKFLIKDILNVKSIVVNKYIQEDNRISVTITTEWNYKDDNGKEITYDQEDKIELTSERIEGNGYPIERDEQYKFRQYMIAKGYSLFWKNNPYIEE